MPPKTKPKAKAYKIMRDKKGNRYLLVKKKRILIPPDITDVEFIKWLIQYLKPKRKKKKAKVAKSERILLPDLSNAQVLGYTNVERKREGLPLLKMGDKPGEIEFEEAEHRLEAPPAAPALEHVPEVEVKTPRRKPGPGSLAPSCDQTNVSLQVTNLIMPEIGTSSARK